MMDIIFTNARVIDGSGAPSHIADVAIKGSRISRIGRGFDTTDTANARIIDCEGVWAISPGFIDMHAHSDIALLSEPEHSCKISQGVTTEVIGQDGISYAPVDNKCLAIIREQITGWNGNPSDPSFWSWRTTKEFLDTLDSQRIATNAAFLVPQGNLRMLVLGYDPREATAREIEQMKTILDRALTEGAVGMSSGLTYVPGMYAPDSELAELLHIVANHDGYYCPHHRSYGKGALDAYREMIDLAKKTGVRLHLAHCVMNFAENKGKAPALLKLIQESRASGVHITLDSYPYLPGATTLAAMLPSWCSAGGASELLRRLKDPRELEKIRYDVTIKGCDGCHGCTLDWSTIEISSVTNPELRDIVGLTIDQIGLHKALEPFDAFVWILLEDNLRSSILQHIGHEENVREIMRDEFHCGGSDGILVGCKPHPRAWGTFTRYLGHYARDLPRGYSRDIYGAGDMVQVKPEVVFEGGLEEAVAHLTSRPAAVLKLSDRGLAREGYKADLVIFHPELISDGSTFAHPRIPSKGIRFVLVNGKFAVDDFQLTGVREGSTLRGK